MSTRRISPDTQVALLLTGRFGRSTSAAKPLAPTEYNAVAGRLHAEGLRPGDLLGTDASVRLDSRAVDGIAADRLGSLLHRGTSMAVALERWSQRGIRVVGRTDPEYPSRWAERLRARRPPVVFAIGDHSLNDESRRKVAVVGSRNASAGSLEFARRIGESCARSDMVLVSGGAKGIDEEAMLACLAAGGRVVGILACKLESAATAKKWRSGLRENRLLLFSEVSPAAPFSVGNAMSRNRLIFSLADVAVVASSGLKGGTWGGATENLKHEWAPLLVRRAEDAGEGAPRLLDAGAFVLEEPETRDAEAFANRLKVVLTEWSDRPTRGKGDDAPQLPLEREHIVAEPSGVLAAASGLAGGGVDEKSFWELFLSYLDEHSGEALSDKAVADDLDLPLPHVRKWLRRAAAEGIVARTNRPVRYRVIGKTLWGDA